MDEIVVRTSMHKCRQTCAFFHFASTITYYWVYLRADVCTVPLWRVELSTSLQQDHWHTLPRHWSVSRCWSFFHSTVQTTKHKTHNSWRSWNMYHDNGSMIHFYFSECPLQTPRPADTAWSWPYSGAAIQCRPEARDNNYSSYRYHDSSIRSLEPRQW